MPISLCGFPVAFPEDAAGIQSTMAAAAHPVRTLRGRITQLEAAITLALADPKPGPVHHLRTSTRRIEAQLELLALLPDLPTHDQPARKARKQLRKLRRAAGRVRDLDVLRDLVPSKSGDADQLRRLFKHRRRQAAQRLTDTLRKRQGKLTRSLEALLDALAPAESLALAPRHLATLALDWYARRAPASAKQNHRQLHDTRKAAKLARYLAESATSTATRSLTRTFESLQQAGGNWHDWLTLSEIAHHELGTASRLTQTLTRRCQRSLTEYQTHLKSLPQKLPTL
jgi:CHAD domain-containing protein